MLSAIFGTFSFAAFAEGFTAVVAVYSLYKDKGISAYRRKPGKHRSQNQKNTGGRRQ